MREKRSVGGARGDAGPAAGAETAEESNGMEDETAARRTAGRDCCGRPDAVERAWVSRAAAAAGVPLTARSPLYGSHSAMSGCCLAAVVDATSPYAPDAACACRCAHS